MDNREPRAFKHEEGIQALQRAFKPADTKLQLNLTQVNGGAPELKCSFNHSRTTQTALTRAC